MAVTWMGCSATTGAVISELATFEAQQVQSAIGAYATTSATMPVPEGPSDDWLIATEPFATYVVLLDDGVPTWGGIVLRRLRVAGGGLLLSLIDPAGYFDRRYVQTASFAATSQTEIARSLVADNAADSLPLQFAVADSDTTRTRSYVERRDQTLYSALTELSGDDGGPEWCIEWAETTYGLKPAYVPVFRCADTLGTPITTPRPNVTLSIPGTARSATLTESYAAEDGANDVLATSTSTGSERPQSARAVDALTVRLKTEFRFTPAAAITDTTTLDGHATAALERMKDGGLALEVEVDGENPLGLGSELSLGDTVGVEVEGREFPGGLVGTARVTGYTRTFGKRPTFRPVLTDVEVSA